MSSDGSASVEERRLNFEVEKHARERWWHEDELINQRTSWLLTTQGVLGTAFGFIKYRVAELTFKVPGAQPEFEYSKYIGTLKVFADALVAIGLLGATMSLLGIYAAKRAQGYLRSVYGAHLGVNPFTTRIGHFVSMSTPLLCILAWLVAFAVFRR